MELCGRSEILSTIKELFSSNNSSVPCVILKGTGSGCGKSALLERIRDTLGEEKCLLGRCDRLQQARPFHAFKRILRQVFHFTKDLTVDAQKGNLGERFAEDPNFIKGVFPVLQQAMKLDWSLDEGGIEGLSRDPKHQVDPLTVLHQIIEKVCEGKIIAIDDCNCIDSGSLHLVTKLMSAVPRNVGVIIALDDPDGTLLQASGINQFCQANEVRIINIKPLGGEDARELISTRAHVPKESVSQELVDFAVKVSDGNCFFLEQIALTVKFDADKHVNMEEITAKWQTADSIVLQEAWSTLEKPQKELCLIVALVTESMGHNGAAAEMLQKVSPRKVKKKLKVYLKELTEKGIIRKLGNDKYSSTSTDTYELKHLRLKPIVMQSCGIDAAGIKKYYGKIADWFTHRYYEDLRPWYPLIAHYYVLAGEKQATAARKYCKFSAQEALYQWRFQEAKMWVNIAAKYPRVEDDTNDLLAVVARLESEIASGGGVGALNSPEQSGASDCEKLRADISANAASSPPSTELISEMLSNALRASNCSDTCTLQ